MNAMLCECITAPLTRAEAVVLRDLLARGSCSAERLFAQVWGHLAAGGIPDRFGAVPAVIATLSPKLVPSLRLVDVAGGRAWRLTGFINFRGFT